MNYNLWISTCCQNWTTPFETDILKLIWHTFKDGTCFNEWQYILKISKIISLCMVNGCSYANPIWQWLSMLRKNRVGENWRLLIYSHSWHTCTVVGGRRYGIIPSHTHVTPLPRKNGMSNWYKAYIPKINANIHLISNGLLEKSRILSILRLSSRSTADK